MSITLPKKKDFSQMKSRPDAVAAAKKDLDTPRSGGGLAGSIFDLSLAPYPLEPWKPDRVASNWELDILAMPTENENNPMIRAGQTAVGEWHFHLSVEVHQFLAGSNQDMLCLKQLGRKCPACEMFFQFHDEHNKGLDKNDPRRKKNPYAVSKRSYMLVRPRKNNPEDKVFLYNASGAVQEFVDSLLTAANNTRGGKAPVDFAHPQNGAVVLFDTVKGKMEKHFPATNFGFEARPEFEGLALWERTFALDSILKIPTLSEMEDVLYDAPKASEEEEAPAASQGNRRDEYRREEADVSADAPRSGRGVVPGTDKVQEPPKSQPEQASTAQGCPHGLKFGVSYAEKPEPRACRNCGKYDDCVMAGA